MIGALLPAGVERFLLWQRRFTSLGFSEPRAAFAAGSRAYKQAYDASRIGHLPDGVRSQLRYVVDVGANHGQWTSALLTLVRPERMDIFEPNPQAFASLQRKLGSRSDSVLRLHEIALGAEPGELPLKVTNRSDFSSFLAPASDVSKYYGHDAAAVAKSVLVRVDTLDNVLRDTPMIDLLKIDVQGFERQVLAGAHSTLQHTRTLLLEANLVRHYETDDSFGRLADLLDSLGFGVWDISQPFHAPNGRALWCDAVFFNRALLPAE